MSEQYLDRLDWPLLEQQLDQDGCAVIASLLSHKACDRISALYGQTEPFRSQVIMARHGFGRGEYKYFDYPLPPLVARLRSALYPRLVPIANRWHEQMDLPSRFPDSHPAFLERCHAAGQQRPTPLLLQYGPQDYNCLHQDLYGEHASHCRWRFFCQNRGKTSPAVSSCSPSSVRACSRARRSSV
jgi:hypothetical protein